MPQFFTSESVCAGHPDKVADQISDAILDEVLSADPKGRAAVETLVTENKVVLAGEVDAWAKIDYAAVARREIRRLGYTNGHFGFSDRAQVEVLIHEQAAPLAKNAEAKGAGDQGMMFGFACTETPEMMPLPITLANRLAEKLDLVKTNGLTYLRPDGKTQVTVEYENSRPVAVSKIVMAVPFGKKKSSFSVKKELYEAVVVPVLAKYGYEIPLSKFVFNNAGAWHWGGPGVDTGLTGRKIIVDTYGGYARVGGGAFSGKDPTKVDRSGAYAARFLAKNIVAAELASKVEVGLAYVIGGKKPVATRIETFGTAKASEKEIAGYTSKLINPSVSGIISQLKLDQPIYLPAASYGHFGREGFPWEEIKKSHGK